MTGGSVIHPVMAPRHVDERATAGLAVRGWVTGNGSSLSAPIVAGLAATLWELFPRVTAPQLKSAIVEGAADLHAGTFYWPKGIVPSEMGMNGARVHRRELSKSPPAGRAEFDGACRRLAFVDRDAAESVLYAPAGQRS